MSETDTREPRWWLAALELIALLCVPALALPVPAAAPLLAAAAVSLWLRGKGFGDVGLAATTDSWAIFATGLVLGALALAAAAWLLGPAVQKIASKQVEFNYLPPVRGNAAVLVQAVILAWAAAAAAEMVFRGYLLDRLTGDLGLSNAWAIALSSALYGWAVAAGQGPGLGPRFAGGLVMGAGYGALYLAGRRNLVLPIAFHGAFESGNLLLMYLRLI